MRPASARRLSLSLSLTAAVAFLLVASVQTVSVGVAVPPERDAVAVSALVLVAVTLHLTAVLCGRQEPRVSVSGEGLARREKQERYLVRSVSTVVVSITLPAAGNAAAVRAGELALRTLARH